MRRFFTSRLFRACVCLILVCCVLVLNSPIQVNAAAGGLVAAEIVKVSTVSCNPYVVAGACLIALGVWAAADMGVFEQCARGAAAWLEQDGWARNGAIEVLQTVTAAGEKAWYVAGDMLESVRGWLFDSGTVVSCSSSLSSPWEVYVSSAPVLQFAGGCLTASGYVQHWSIAVSSDPFVLKGSEGIFGSTNRGGYYGYTIRDYSIKGDVFDSEFVGGKYGTWLGAFDGWTAFLEYLATLSFGHSSLVASGVSLGNVPDFYIDGTSALEWAPEYANRQLRVINTGGGNNPDGGGDGDPNWKWYMPLVLGSMAALLTQVQSDQWSGVTPSEFPEVSTTQEFEILDLPEIGGFLGIEIQPITQPGTNPDTGSGTDPDSGSESDPEKESVPLPGVTPGIGTGTNPGTGTDPGTDPGTNPGTNPGTGTDPGTNPGTNPGTGTDPGTNPGTNPGTGTETPPESMQPFMLDLRDFFPFCIPFDLYKFFSLLCAEPEAPVFTWVVQDLSGNSYPISVDLSKWDKFAALFRKLQLFVFVIGLAMSSRKFIKW